MSKYDARYWAKCLRDPGWRGTPLVNKQMAEFIESQSAENKGLRNNLLSISLGHNDPVGLARNALSHAANSQE